MLTLARTWTQRQKWLIVASVVLMVAAFGLSIYTYERYHRGPGAEVLSGTWEVAGVFRDQVYLHLESGGSFFVAEGSGDELSYDPRLRGRWYAGGTKIYLRFHGEGDPRPTMILHIVDIQADELRIRYTNQGEVYTYRRAHPKSSNASNQAMERTATRRAFNFRVAWSRSLQSTRALGGCRSSCSR